MKVLCAPRRGGSTSLCKGEGADVPKSRACVRVYYLGAESISKRMATLLSFGENDRAITQSGRMDQATVALLSTQATQAKLQYCELDYPFGRESKSCVAAGDTLESWWRLSRNPVINQALPNAWFKKQGLYSLLENYELLNLQPEPPYATNACTVV